MRRITRYRSTVLLAATTLALLLVAACGNGAQTEISDEDSQVVASRDISGYVELWPDDEIRQVGGFYEIGDECDGNSVTGPDDLRYFGEQFEPFGAGAEVTVKNEDGTLIGTAQLDAGEWAAEPTDTNLDDHLCRLRFSVEVEEATFYEVEAGGEKKTVPAAEASGEVVIEVRDR